MAGHGEKLSRNQEKAIAALLSQPSIPGAAKEAKIGERTLWRWLQLDSFKEAYRDARGQIVRQAVVQVQQAMSEAVGTLREVMTNSEAPASARVSAAKAIINMGIKAVEVEELEARIVEIETLIKEKKI
ncbi:hypothetical protein ACFLZG_05585 [Thermodesulfobacteriota bacterium]